jgi:predicted RNase H-like nuclease (RuvC/YqgF family)
MNNFHFNAQDLIQLLVLGCGLIWQLALIEKSMNKEINNLEKNLLEKISVRFHNLRDELNRIYGILDERVDLLEKKLEVFSYRIDNLEKCLSQNGVNCRNEIK